MYVRGPLPRVRQGFAVAITVASLLVFAGCKARAPGSLESSLFQGAKRRLTIGGRSDPNPLQATPENIHHGQRHFAVYCMVCHGLDGQNTGVPFADKMAPPVPPLTSTSVQAYSDGQLHWIIQNGIFPSGMPPSKDVFRDEEIWQMVLYIRHLPPKGSLGEPQVYSGEMGPSSKVNADQTKSDSSNLRPGIP
jgi:mono/diheme cytochrome c family protein